MTMVEKVARALFEYQRSLNNVYVPPWDEHLELKNYWYALASAAIEAMREPTEEMLAATQLRNGVTKPVWAVMIDAALAEK